LYGLIPDGPGEVIPDVAVLVIRGVPRSSAWLTRRRSNGSRVQSRERAISTTSGKERSPDLTRKAIEDHLRRLGGPPDLEEILKLKLDSRRDQQVGAVEELTNPRGKRSSRPANIQVTT
jgi:hypothetical protein